MSQYQVPQFIDVESKIVGPLTLKQFIYLAVGFLLSFFSFFILKFFIWLVFILIVGGVVLTFAFVKYNGRPFPILLKSILKYFWQPKKYIFKKELKAPIVNSNLEDLNLRLNTSKEVTKGERFLLPFLKRLRPQNKNKFEVLKKITGEKETARRVDYR